MNNKGITKFWIEIIGGVIVVVIILVIFLYAGTAVGTAVEDAAAVNEFDAFMQTMAKAYVDGSHLTSPWKLVNSRDDSVYAIVILTGNLKERLSGWRDLDSASNFTLSKCDNLQLDHCLCLLSIKYRAVGWPVKVTCDDLPFNIISVNSNKDYDIERKNIEDWYKNNFLLTYMEQVKVLSCSSAGTVCSWTDANRNSVPCFIHYKEQPVVWLSAQGGLGRYGIVSTYDFGMLDFEILEMKKDVSNFYIDMNPRLLSGSICAVKNCEPCHGCDLCEHNPKPLLWSCTDNYVGGTYCQ